MPKFDAIVIGTGQAGPSLARRLVAAGRKVAVIERKHFGGTCVNTGCTPTKALVASAYAAHVARRHADYGVTIGGPIGVDMKAVKARKDAIVAPSRNGVERSLKSLEGCTVYQGHGRFVAPNAVKVGETVLEAPQIFINVGGRASVPPMPGLDQVPYLTNSTMMDVDFLPEHLVVVGGSYIGLEFAQAYRRFGAQVTVIEMAPRLIAREDEDVSMGVADVLEAEGIELRLNATCLAVEKHADGVAVNVECTEGAPQVVGSHLLLAVGRRPNTDDLGLDKAGVTTDARGYITVDDQLRTNVPGIFALGDCNGRGAFTHTAYNDFEIVAANLLDGERAPRQRPHHGLRALHRSAARPLRHDRGGSAQVRPAGADRHHADGGREPRLREGRDQRLHEDPGRQGDRSSSSARRCSGSTATRSSTRCSTRCTPRRHTP